MNSKSADKYAAVRDKSPTSSTLASSSEIDRDARVRSYVAANTATPELARAKLREIGIIDRNGKLTKPYR